MADGIEAGIEAMLEENFIDTADDGVIAVYESLLGLSSEGKTLEERRGVIKSYIVGLGKISKTVICNAIYQISGRECEVEFKDWDSDGNQGLFITQSGREANEYEDEIIAFLDRRLPAHIIYKYEYTRIINTWGEAKAKLGTWGMGANYTWAGAKYYNGTTWLYVSDAGEVYIQEDETGANAYAVFEEDAAYAVMIE